MGIGCLWHTAVWPVRQVKIFVTTRQFSLAIIFTLFLTWWALHVLYISLFLLSKNLTENLVDVSSQFYWLNFPKDVKNEFGYYLFLQLLPAGFIGFCKTEYTTFYFNRFKFIWMGSQAGCECYTGNDIYSSF